MKIFLQWYFNKQSHLSMVTAAQLKLSPMLIGRSPECQMVVGDPTVSRKHVKLFWKDGSVWLRNINKSQNVVRVNQHLLGPDQAVTLTSGDRIQLGQVAISLNFSTDEIPTQPHNPAVVDKPSREPVSSEQWGYTRCQVGQTIGKYTLTERLGRGAMAEVFKARQPHLDRDVAIKILHPHLANQEGFVSRFKREAHSLSQLQHPHILRVFDFDHQENGYYMVMDYLPGSNLHQYLLEHGPLSVSETLNIIKQITEALHYAHQQKIIHRDIKPENVMFTDESHSKAMLTDFGLARLTHQRLTLTGTKIGTPGYMSPEVAQGDKADARADIYSVGVMLYQMLTGEMPYTGHTPLMVLEKQLHNPLLPPSYHVDTIPAEVDALVQRAMSAKVAERFQTVAELHKAIQKASRNVSKTKNKRPKWSSALGTPTQWKRLTQRWWPLVAAMTGVVSIAGATVGALLMA